MPIHTARPLRKPGICLFFCASQSVMNKKARIGMNKKRKRKPKYVMLFYVFAEGVGWEPSIHLHLHTGPRFQCCTHVRMDLVMRKFKFICLQQACNDNACLRLPKRRADANTRPTTKWDV